MRKAIYVIVIVLLAGGGAYIAVNSEGDRSASWFGKHLEVIQSQLIDLKDHLHAYKDAHGQYPTNDEGLAALDNFDAKFEITLYRHPEEDPEEISFYRDFYWYEHWKHTITRYRREHGGKAPQSALDLEQTRFGYIVMDPYDSELKPVPMEVAVGRKDSLFFLSPAGVLSPWLVPYVYENRNGLDPNIFRDSPVTRDRRGRYSVRVDDGIYVYSVGGQVYSRKFDREWWAYYGPFFAGCGLVLASVVLVVVLMRRSKKLGLIGGMAMLVSAGGIYALKACYITCYVPSPLFSYRYPEILSKQRELLDSFHQRGVICDETYTKALAALERAPTTEEADR